MCTFQKSPYILGAFTWLDQTGKVTLKSRINKILLLKIYYSVWELSREKPQGYITLFCFSLKSQAVFSC